MADVAPPRSAEILADKLRLKLTDPAFADELKTNPETVNELAQTSVAESDGTTKLSIANKQADRDVTTAIADKEVYVFAVKALGAVAILSVIAILAVCVPQLVMLMKAGIAVAGSDVNKLANVSVAFSIPDGLVALGSAAIGALAGLLGPLSARR